MELTRREFIDGLKKCLIEKIEKDFNGVLKIKSIDIGYENKYHTWFCEYGTLIEICLEYGNFEGWFNFITPIGLKESHELIINNFYSAICVKTMVAGVLNEVNDCDIKNFKLEDYKLLLDYLKVDTSDLSDEEIELFIETRKYFKDDYYRELIYSFTNLELPDDICFTYRRKKQIKKSIRRIKLTAYIIKKLTQEQKEILDLNFLY